MATLLPNISPSLATVLTAPSNGDALSSSEIRTLAQALLDSVHNIAEVSTWGIKDLVFTASGSAAITSGSQTTIQTLTLNAALEASDVVITTVRGKVQSNTATYVAVDTSLNSGLDILWGYHQSVDYTLSGTFINSGSDGTGDTAINIQGGRDGAGSVFLTHLQSMAIVLGARS